MSSLTINTRTQFRLSLIEGKVEGGIQNPSKDSNFNSMTDSKSSTGLPFWSFQSWKDWKREFITNTIRNGLYFLPIFSPSNFLSLSYQAQHYRSPLKGDKLKLLRIYGFSENIRQYPKFNLHHFHKPTKSYAESIPKKNFKKKEKVENRPRKL